jgi:hypothetical protein
LKKNPEGQLFILSMVFVENESSQCKVWAFQKFVQNLTNQPTPDYPGLFVGSLD